MIFFCDSSKGLQPRSSLVINEQTAVMKTVDISAAYLCNEIMHTHIIQFAADVSGYCLPRSNESHINPGIWWFLHLVLRWFLLLLFFFFYEKQYEFPSYIIKWFGREGNVTLGSVGVVALSLAEEVREKSGEGTTHHRSTRSMWRNVWYLRLAPHIANHPTNVKEETQWQVIHLYVNVRT